MASHHGRGAQAAIGAEQFQQIGGARARQPGDDDRAFDRHLQAVRMALDVVFQAQPRRCQAHTHLEEVGAGDRRCVAILVDRAEPYGETRAEIVGAEIRKAGFGLGCLQHSFRRKGDGKRGRGLEGALLGVCQHRRAQIGEFDSACRTICLAHPKTLPIRAQAVATRCKRVLPAGRIALANGKAILKNRVYRSMHARTSVRSHRQGRFGDRGQFRNRIWLRTRPGARGARMW